AMPASVTVFAGQIIVWSGPALTTGGSLKGRTITRICALAVNWESETERRRRYVPLSLNVAVVFGEAALAKVTVPGPAILFHVNANTLPAGSPSSVALPVRETVFTGKVIVWSGPTLTTGGKLAEVVLMATSALAVNWESSPVSRNT